MGGKSRKSGSTGSTRLRGKLAGGTGGSNTPAPSPSLIQRSVLGSFSASKARRETERKVNTSTAATLRSYQSQGRRRPSKAERDLFG